jgi:Fe2+ transport system protein FeoA
LSEIIPATSLGLEKMVELKSRPFHRGEEHNNAELNESSAHAHLDGVYETTLCQLAPRQLGTIVRVQGESTLRNHLLEMGFTRGTRIEFLRRAPLGDPIDVKLRGYRLSLREREACAIVVSTKRPDPKPKWFLGSRETGK